MFDSLVLGGFAPSASRGFVALSPTFGIDFFLAGLLLTEGVTLGVEWAL